MTFVGSFIFLSYIILFFSLKDEDIFYAIFFLTLLSSITYTSANKIFSKSYVIREVKPRNKAEYLWTVIIIVVIIYGLYEIDSTLFFKLHSSKDKELRALALVLDIFAWQTYAYKILNSLFFLRYLYILKKTPAI